MASVFKTVVTLIYGFNNCLKFTSGSIDYIITCFVPLLLHVMILVDPCIFELVWSH